MNDTITPTVQQQSWEAQSQAKIDLVLREIMAWGAALGREGQLPPLPAQATLLRELYEQALPLARLMDRSQLVLHAEGPGANHDAPWLPALKWLTDTTHSVLKHLTREWLNTRGVDGRELAKRVDWRIAGMAPGSLWLGVRAEMPQRDLLPRDAALLQELGDTLAKLPLAGRFIDDEGLRPGVHEAVEDPALLDVVLDGLWRLSPTGKAGIHSLGVSAPEYGQITVSQRERVVLADVLRRPKMERLHEGGFVGEIRLVDLDKSRATLRTSDGAIRCAIGNIQHDTAREVLGRVVEVFGAYETDKQGRPRMLYVQRIRPTAQQTALADQ